MKFAVTRNPLPNSKAPSFKVHNLRAAYKDSSGYIVHLIREPPDEDTDPQEFLVEMQMAQQVTSPTDSRTLFFIHSVALFYHVIRFFFFYIF